MPTDLQFQLAAPLFLSALVIAQSFEFSTGSEPPAPQPVLRYINRSYPKATVKRRNRIAHVAVRIAAQVFVRSNCAAPAGVCWDAGPEARLDKMDSWIIWLAHLTPTTALAMLACNAQFVHDNVYTAVQNEYNAGIRTSKLTCLTQLQSGELADRMRSLPCNACMESVHQLAPVDRSAAHDQPRFYYIGAGVGCGIREAQQVCSSLRLLYDLAMLFHLLYCHSKDAASSHAMQEGFVCAGVCEIDEYCQQVRWASHARLRVAEVSFVSMC
jgi:hypothetical protein